MKLDKAFRPFKGTVTTNGDRTVFSVSDSIWDEEKQKWENGDWYNVSVMGLNFPIEKKNPIGYKIVPKLISGVTFGRFKGKMSVTVWLEDCAITDKDGNIIINSVKEGARKIGKTLNEVQSAIPEGFEKVDDENIPF